MRLVVKTNGVLMPKLDSPKDTLKRQKESSTWNRSVEMTKGPWHCTVQARSCTDAAEKPVRGAFNSEEALFFFLCTWEDEILFKKKGSFVHHR